MLCFRGRAMSGVFVSLEVLGIALRLVAWFGLWARDARVPLFDVEPTCVAVVPIRKMFGGVGVGRSSWLLLLCCHLIVWWRYVSLLMVVACSIYGRCSCTSPSLLIPPPSS